MTAFAIWLCGALPALALTLECRPRSVGEYVAAAAIVIFWPLCLLAFFVALLRSERT